MSLQQPHAPQDPTRITHMPPVVTDSTTVAAVRPDRTFAYSDADWREIKLSLACVGIDADALTVGDRWWAQPDPAIALTADPRRSLREQLQELAADYRGLSRQRKERPALTPKQEAAKIQKALDVLDRASRTLNSSRVGIIARESGAVREAINAFTVKAERWRDRLKARGNRRSANARKAHIEYWGDLAVLWKAITTGQAPRGRSHFLYVCSAPAFPETTRDRIQTFLKRGRKPLRTWRTDNQLG